jgi:hypothetical protein
MKAILGFLQSVSTMKKRVKMETRQGIAEKGTNITQASKSK